MELKASPMGVINRLLAAVLISFGLAGGSSLLSHAGALQDKPVEYSGSISEQARSHEISASRRNVVPLPQSAPIRHAVSVQQAAPTPTSPTSISPMLIAPMQEAVALPQHEATMPAPGKVYVFRGIGGKMATMELDHIAARIEKAGVPAETYNHYEWWDPADEAIANYKRAGGHYPIVLIGHSAGADASVSFAEKLKDAGVPVSLIVAFDPTRMPKSVPANVDRFINIYQSLNVFGGGFVSPGSEFRGHYASIDMKKYWDVLHVQLVKVRALQDQIIAKIVQINTAQPQLEGATIPIHYVMPRDEKIQLWDSGLPVQAENGDTLRSMASRYAVPVWVLAQINELEPSASLRPGQKLIVPRNLDVASMTNPISSYAPGQH